MKLRWVRGLQSHRKSEADLGQADSLAGPRRAPAGRTQGGKEKEGGKWGSVAYSGITPGL